MASPDTNWAEKRENGFIWYLLVDGVFFMGGPFAVMMQLARYVLLTDASETFSNYFISARTWIIFFAHAILFGGIMGCIKWWRNEKAFANENKTTQ